jgi:L,D-peptidoglycan transpeptidase YkuD (ErfK/YbiS/YcfS/YnhG family)
MNARCIGALLLVVAAGLSRASFADPNTPTPLRSDARQLVLVMTPGWDAGSGVLRSFARTERGWQPAGDPVPVVIGRAGAAWGIGLHPPQSGRQKREGDGRSPAGAFAIGIAFGYPETVDTALPYLPMDADDYCIDVSTSPLYNRIVDAAEVGADAIAGSTEPMRRDLHVDGDQRYRIGFVIEHNAAGKTDAGSCIFAHLWKSADTATAGCTAMAEPAMHRLLSWLRPGAHPLFVLLPEPEYDRLQVAWDLPVF